MDKEDKFQTEAAIDVLKNRFGIDRPTQNQIDDLKSILFHAWLRRRVILDDRLTNRERLCLLFASHGKTYIEIAQTLGISAGTIRNYEKEILRKLFCKSMKQAIAIGIRYGEIALPEKV